jgi:hypothetical protein
MAKTEHRERGHHPNSPSNYGKWELCALFTNKGGTSDAAERGTQRHEVFEKGIADRNRECGWNEDGTERSTG